LEAGGGPPRTSEIDSGVDINGFGVFDPPERQATGWDVPIVNRHEGEPVTAPRRF